MADLLSSVKILATRLTDCHIYIYATNDMLHRANLQVYVTGWQIYLRGVKQRRQFPECASSPL